MSSNEQIAVNALSALMWNVVKQVFADDPTRLRLADFIKSFHTPTDNSAMVCQESYNDIMYSLAEAISMWNVDTVAGKLIDGWIDTLRQLDFTMELSLNPESDINKCDQRIKHAQESILFINSNATESSGENCNKFVIDKLRPYIVDLQHQRSIIVVRKSSQELDAELAALASKWVAKLVEMRHAKCDALFTSSATLMTRLEVRLDDYNIVNGKHADWDIEAIDTITNLWHILLRRAKDPTAPRADIAKMHALKPFD